VLLLAAPLSAADVPGTAGRVQAGGYVDGLAVAGTEDAQRQRPQALLAVHLDGTAARWLRGRLELRTRVGGPFEGGHPGLYDLVHAFQNRSPSVEVNQAAVDVLLRRADLRIGVQKFTWGKLDGIPPTDVLNPRDYHDPIVQDFEERKIGVPALLGTYYLPDVPRAALADLRASLAWMPIAVPSRLALIEERWFPSSIAPASRLVIPAARVEKLTMGALDQRLVVPVNFQTLNHRPPKQLDAGGIAFRLGGRWRSADWDLYHYTGPETGPNADLRSVAFLRNDPSNTIRIRSEARLRQAHDVIHMTGTDWAMALGDVTVRAEAAVFQNRPYLRSASDVVSEALADLPKSFFTRLSGDGHERVPLGDLFVDLDSVEWGVGADTVFHGFRPLLQVNQVALLERAPRLLVADPETRLSASLRQHLLQERLELELRGVYAVGRGSWFVLPRVSYALRDDLRVRLGYLAIGGPAASLIGQFRRNDEFVLQARWSF
jgi:hypothetical protein